MESGTAARPEVHRTYDSTVVRLDRPDDLSEKESFRIGQINYEVIVSVSDCTRDNLVWRRDVPGGQCCRQTWNYAALYIY